MLFLLGLADQIRCVGAAQIQQGGEVPRAYYQPQRGRATVIVQPEPSNSQLLISSWREHTGLGVAGPGPTQSPKFRGLAVEILLCKWCRKLSWPWRRRLSCLGTPLGSEIHFRKIHTGTCPIGSSALHKSFYLRNCLSIPSPNAALEDAVPRPRAKRTSLDSCTL